MNAFYDLKQCNMALPQIINNLLGGVPTHSEHLDLRSHRHILLAPPLYSYARMGLHNMACRQIAARLSLNCRQIARRSVSPTDDTRPRL